MAGGEKKKKKKGKKENRRKSNLPRLASAKGKEGESNLAARIVRGGMGVWGGKKEKKKRKSQRLKYALRRHNIESGRKKRLRKPS